MHACSLSLCLTVHISFVTLSSLSLASYTQQVACRLRRIRTSLTHPFTRRQMPSTQLWSWFHLSHRRHRWHYCSSPPVEAFQPLTVLSGPVRQRKPRQGFANIRPACLAWLGIRSGRERRVCVWGSAASCTSAGIFGWPRAPRFAERVARGRRLGSQLIPLVWQKAAGWLPEPEPQLPRILFIGEPQQWPSGIVGRPSICSRR